ncbi:MAG TPA: lysoplasmalogenase family protein [Spirochaetota bacterium]|nr:lysoplasmalogenase family protein [Spirochaetota bacterium]HPC42374.1 lysoplasmalogenase family protein [Spirochaetota bacterium]HPL16408.1 lysoplasmalogenase family protein [Spirochaetota bacterium]HQF08037.1 lysoplasmalogenase family protein [Spirochaetota bacterium]HQH96597.1 lysoplasmalogenase family protein [Spirochaetota bacterium]
MDGQGFGRTAAAVFVSSGITFAMVIAHEMVRYCTGSPIMAIDWAANALMVATALYLRGRVDVDQFSRAVTETVPEGRPVNPMRFINGMPAAIAVSFAAAVAIRYNFMAGMILYLAMQVFLIYSFTGILPHGFRDILAGTLRIYYTVVAVLCLLVPAAMFYLFIHNGLQTLVVVPYMLFLSLMTMMTYFAFASSDRPFMFRLAPVIASTMFVVSDIMVGYDAFRNPGDKCYAAISMTYITAMLLFNVTILFLRTGKGEEVVS